MKGYRLHSRGPLRWAGPNTQKLLGPAPAHLWLLRDGLQGPRNQGQCYLQLYFYQVSLLKAVSPSQTLGVTNTRAQTRTTCLAIGKPVSSASNLRMHLGSGRAGWTRDRKGQGGTAAGPGAELGRLGWPQTPAHVTETG